MGLWIPAAAAPLSPLCPAPLRGAGGSVLVRGAARFAVDSCLDTWGPECDDSAVLLWPPPQVLDFLSFLAPNRWWTSASFSACLASLAGRIRPDIRPGPPFGGTTEVGGGFLLIPPRRPVPFWSLVNVLQYLLGDQFRSGTPGFRLLLSVQFPYVFLSSCLPSPFEGWGLLVPSPSGRPIAIATALSKVLEKVVLHRLEAYLYTLDNQFSYKGRRWPSDALQDLINVCQVYAAKHDIVYNTTKTECMVVSLARAQTTKLLVVANTLQRKFSYCSREVKMELFRSHCYSIYCNSLWSRYKVAAMNRLKVCHNDILKKLLGLPRWCSSSLAFARNGVNNLDVIRRHSVFSLRSRVELSTNSIITSVRQSSAYVCGPIQQRWLGLLFVQNVG
ncbi:hypothetical protein GWK47_018164 [Chionoecetes opilio]|uniref:Reverse transcriptase domain-containing protein n=1 Tax=Chionoecetes opilio TaxID=41210 RepID=A0A8J4XZU5_CHIOP|nr:hypothetical protein GWK47_018164 [Chionoecetes opilio]